MKRLIFITALICSVVVSAQEFKASGRAKAFKGTEGEVITFIPVNDNKQVVVFAENTYGANNDKAVVYELKSPLLYPSAAMTKKDSTADAWLNVMGRDDKGNWHYSDKIKNEKKEWYTFSLTYSEELSKKINVAKILKTAKKYVDE